MLTEFRGRGIVQLSRCAIQVQDEEALWFMTEHHAERAQAS